MKTAKPKRINWRNWRITQKLVDYDWQRLHPRNLRHMKISWRKPRLRRRDLIWLIICALLLILLGLCALAYRHTANLLPSEDMASRWAGASEERFTQISCFFERDEAPTVEQLLQFSREVDQALLDASLEAAEGGRLWTYAYSARDDKISVSGDHGAADAAAFGIAGDYFLFHPLRLLDGSYISAADLMDDLVVLDEELAWRTYGSADLAGLSVTINDKPYLIAGVISREQDRYNSLTYPTIPTIYMSYSAFTKISEAPVSSYQIVLPDPISGFGYNLIKEKFPLGDHGEAVENSGRFSWGAVANTLLNYAERTIKDNEIAYPYWENAARLAENHLSVLLALSCLLALFPAGSLIYLIVKEIKHVKHHLKKPRQNI